MKTYYLPALFAASLVTLTAFAAPSVLAATAFQQVVNVAAEDVLNLRASPSGNANVIGSIPHNGRTIVATGRQDGNWVQVNWAGQTGWVHNRYLRTSSAVATPRAVRNARPVRAPAQRPAAPRVVAGYTHSHPANECTRSISHTHPNGQNPHQHRYACTQNMVKPKFKPKFHTQEPEVVVPQIKY